MPQISYNHPHPEHLMLAPQPPPTSPPTRKRKQPVMSSMAGLSSMPPSGLGDPGGLGESMEPLGETMPPVNVPKKSRTNTPWTPAEEQRLKMMRDAQNSWGEIAKVRRVMFEGRFNSNRLKKTFPNRTEGSVKKHWYKVCLQQEGKVPSWEVNHDAGYALCRFC